jgi:hypothetical protein
VRQRMDDPAQLRRGERACEQQPKEYYSHRRLAGYPRGIDEAVVQIVPALSEHLEAPR